MIAHADMGGTHGSSKGRRGVQAKPEVGSGHVRPGVCIGRRWLDLTGQKVGHGPQEHAHGLSVDMQDM